MTQSRNHNDCKYFGYKMCPHSNDEIMKKATQDIPQISGTGGLPTLDFPTDEEINTICANCDSFTMMEK